MWYDVVIHCFQLHLELLFTKYGLSYFVQKKKDCCPLENIFYNIIIGNSCRHGPTSSF